MLAFSSMLILVVVMGICVGILLYFSIKLGTVFGEWKYLYLSIPFVIGWGFYAWLVIYLKQVGYFG